MRLLAMPSRSPPPSDGPRAARGFRSRFGFGCFSFLTLGCFSGFSALGCSALGCWAFGSFGVLLKMSDSLISFRRSTPSAPSHSQAAGGHAALDRGAPEQPVELLRLGGAVDRDLV